MIKHVKSEDVERVFKTCREVYSILLECLKFLMFGDSSRYIVLTFEVHKLYMIII